MTVVAPVNVPKPPALRNWVTEAIEADLSRVPPGSDAANSAGAARSSFSSSHAQRAGSISVDLTTDGPTSSSPPVIDDTNPQVTTSSVAPQTNQEEEEKEEEEEEENEAKENRRSKRPNKKKDVLSASDMAAARDPSSGITSLTTSSSLARLSKTVLTKFSLSKVLCIAHASTTMNVAPSTLPHLW
jgi:hypothetical protein